MERRSFEIQQVALDGPPLRDVMGGNCRWRIGVHEHGHVSLVDVMPRLVPEGQTADAAIVQAARVSYGQGTKTPSDDRGLIRYLMRHRHTTPLEMVEFKFHCQMPIFIARQWIRHRMASVNESSARYSEMKDLFYFPARDNVRTQSKTNKQGSDGFIEAEDAEDYLNSLQAHSLDAYDSYKEALDAGVARELARLLLPLNIYTEWYWKIDLHNLIHFLGLRMDSHAQQEIRDYADPIFAMVEKVVPITAEAFLDYHPHMGGMMLSRLEINALRNGDQDLDTTNKGEQADWVKKRERLLK